MLTRRAGGWGVIRFRLLGVRLALTLLVPVVTLLGYAHAAAAAQAPAQQQASVQQQA